MINGSHEKWIVRVIGTLGIGLLWLFLNRSIQSIDNRFQELSAKDVEFQKQDEKEILEIELTKARQANLELNLSEIKIGLKELNLKMDKLSSDFRKR